MKIYRFEKKSKSTDDSLVQNFVNILTRDSMVIDPTHTRKISRDPDDDKFINCALSARALYIVSGDNDLLEIKEVEGIEIVTARTFLDKMTS